MRRTVVLTLLALLGFSSAALAQTGTVVGAVTAEDGGRPIAGVQVRVVGTQVGALTRDDGRYVLAVAPGTYTLRATRIGFAPDSVTGVVVAPGVQTTANFTMRAQAAVLSSVVVIGYGTQEARDVTGVVAQVDTTTFNRGRVVTPEQLIQGKIAGVQVVDNNEPGGGMAIRIRGGTSVSASNDPLYVIDGVPITVGGGASAGRSPMNFINPADIENITVLKDASSTAIYGSRGANGVVIVTTKSGRSGPQFTYSGTVSGSQVTGGPDMLDAAQYRAAVAAEAAGSTVLLGDANVNWLDEIQRSAGGQEHNLSFNGVRDQASYRLGLGYLDQGGVLEGTNTQRVSASLNYSDRLLGDRLRTRVNIRGSRAEDQFTPGSVIGNAVAFAPTQPFMTSDGRFYQYLDTTTGRPANLAPNNPLEELAFVRDEGTTLRSVGNLEGEYELPFLRGLTATVRGGYDVIRADRTTFVPSTIASQLKNASRAGNINRNSPGQLSTVLDAYANYKRDFDTYGSNIDITAGWSGERFRGDYESFYAESLGTNLLGTGGIPFAAYSDPYYTIDEYQLRSGFGRANLSIADRYLFTATVRRDGSSRFATGKQYGTFPSAAFGWRVSEEPMFQDRLPLSDLKFRISWGENGNQAVGNYLPYTRYQFGQRTAQAQLGQVFVPTIRPTGSDPNLSWETTTSTNVGVDYGFMDDRFTGSIDWYTKRTEDLLFNVPTAAGTGLSNFVTTNIGSVQNRGFEFSFDARVLGHGSPRGAFSWTANFNASTNRNRLLSIDRPGITNIRVTDISGAVGTRIQVFQPGQPIFSFYVYEHIRENGRPVGDDVDRNGDGVMNLLDMYVDQNGDSIINEGDLRAHKNPAPRWMLGHTSNFSWRGFDASTTLRAYLGNHVYNNVASNLGNYSVLRGAFAPVNLHASVLDNGFSTPQYFSDVYVEDASFLRMDNLTLGYTFERFANLQNARIFGTIQNVFTTTKYSGVDPTAGLNGVDNNLYPRSRTFLGGVSVGF